MTTGIDWQILLTAVFIVPVAYAATNIDNLLIMATIAGRSSSRRNLVAGFVLASTAVLVIALLATFIDELVPARVIGYLGFVPLSIGIYLLVFARLEENVASSRAKTWPAIAVVLFANSGDTIFALGPLFAESRDRALVGLVIGFIVIAAVWLSLILRLSSRIARSERLTRLGHRLAPWMMILVGLYILSDTTTDVVA